MNIDELDLNALRVEFRNLEREHLETCKRLARLESRAVELVDEADELRAMLGNATNRHATGSFEIACITRAFVVARDEKEATDMANAMLRGEPIQSVQPPQSILSVQELSYKLRTEEQACADAERRRASRERARLRKERKAKQAAQ